ncbi:Rieske 2Fe-2S domain-containing protein [candidate division GN15 bacterium]|nr:Rieske 2Fe-2S domain-containing protein [candidate division GN15 bacterium]
MRFRRGDTEHGAGGSSGANRRVRRNTAGRHLGGLKRLAEFVKVANVSDIPEGKLKGFEIGHNKFVVAHTADGFFAVVDECSHDSAPISDGRVRGKDIMCTRHGARFDLRTGAVTAPPAIVPIDTLEVKIEGDDILVELEED